ncbi:hypothetical protein [Labedaea rhizosphaerae]|uniref:Uncharacterized protein n=1 Tax=Labedaea rhizosphaerae TaxID=598644 RepID=A0A4R6S8A9_LABRH|nr:hypothetical protein [Labedaea rhizosphaerae]TDP96199.1 hypothetical protein EV186_104181 [Labedaea rhizosphaerae]
MALLFELGTENVPDSTIAWFTFGGAVGGVLIAGLVALFVAAGRRRAERRRLVAEHHRQLRLDRREVYAGYWTAWNRLHHDIRTLYLRSRAGEAGDGERLRSSEVDWRAAANLLALLGGPAVVDAARGHVAMTDEKLAQARDGKWHRDHDGAAYRALTAAMRVDLVEPAT